MQEDEKLARRKRANELRLSAIREKSRKTEIQQAQIKKSLQGLDESIKKATHIQFSDSDEDEHQSCAAKVDKNKIAENDKKPKMDVVLGFTDTDSEDEVNIELKPQFQGREGGKLLELQSSYGNDSRFRLNERFAEEGVSLSDEGNAEEHDGREQNDIKSERERNLNLLSQVIGHDVTSKDQVRRKVEKFIDASTRRYDPNKDGHLELKVEKCTEEKPKRKKKKKAEGEAVEADPRKFFEMSTDALKKAFSGKTEENAGEEDKPFSFLAMLGKPEENADNNSRDNGRNMEPTELCGVAPMKNEISTVEQKHFYDSSDSEDEEEDMEDTNLIQEKAESKIDPEEGRSNHCKTFFLTSASDPRIVQGVKDFCWNKPFKQIQQEWLEVKDTLIKDYKKKHRDAKRQQRRAKYEAKMLAAYSDK